LTGVQTQSRIGRNPKPGALRVAAVLCLALVVLLAVAQVTHVHASASDADHCPLCVAMHSVVPLVMMLVAVLLVWVGNPVPVLLEVRMIVRYWHPTLFTRPPPAGC
jgi:hypothetical protein